MEGRMIINFGYLSKRTEERPVSNLIIVDMIILPRPITGIRIGHQSSMILVSVLPVFSFMIRDQY